MDGCLACDLAAGRADLPGGEIHATEHWVVEHCIGALGVGTLVVKPKRHILHVSDLEPAEAHELGPLLRQTAKVVEDLTGADQVYVALWSHAGGTPVHIHFVVQPVTSSVMAEFGEHGPKLQVAMFERGDLPPRGEVEEFAERVRTRLVE
jgi:diadenosine tetraphosphate (Ap4A) HIT family hydrolase